jgi:drug/metabolite transporter (DMT)-like permease
MQPSAARGFLYVLFSICIWSGWFVASRFTVQGALGAGDVTELRFLVGGVILLPVVIRRGLAMAQCCSA